MSDIEIKHPSLVGHREEASDGVIRMKNNLGKVIGF